MCGSESKMPYRLYAKRLLVRSMQATLDFTKIEITWLFLTR